MAKSQYFGLGDRCLETTTTTGTGAITLLGAVTGYRTIMSVVTGSQQFPYVIVGGSEFEVGYGTRTGATTFTRDTVLASSNSGNLVNFSAGTKEVWMDLPSDQIEVLTSARTENLIVNGGCVQKLHVHWESEQRKHHQAHAAHLQNWREAPEETWRGDV